MITVNLIAVVVAAIAAFAVGALWYSVLFGRQWRMLMGMGDGADMGGKMPMVQAMGGGFVATLVMVFVLANLMATAFSSDAIEAIKPNAIGTALTLAFWIWLGFIATVMSNSVWYENRPWKLYFINVSHYLVALLVAAAILAWWPW
jgi:hypothetical protein